MSAILAQLEKSGVPLRWNCRSAKLVIGAGSERDRIVLNLEMHKGGNLSIDEQVVEEAIADLYCGEASRTSDQGEYQAIGVLSLNESDVFVRVILPPIQFVALQSIVGRGARLETVIINVQGLKSEEYGTGVWNRETALRGSPIVAFSVYSSAEEETSLPEPDPRISAIEQSIRRIEAQASKMLTAAPWIICLLAALVVVTLLRGR